MVETPGQQSTRQPANAGQAQWLFLCTIGGIVLYALIDIVAQLLPPHYNPISQAESDLAVGPYGYLMAINFILRGLLSLAFLFGFARVTAANRSPAGLTLLGIWAVGALILALFPTDVSASTHTRHGLIHLLTAVIAFICGALGELILARNMGLHAALRPIQRAMTLLAVAALVLCALTFFGPALGLSGIGGLLERVFLALVLLWMLVVSLALYRKRA